MCSVTAMKKEESPFMALSQESSLYLYLANKFPGCYFVLGLQVDDDD